jgi:hypothetical protein
MDNLELSVRLLAVLALPRSCVRSRRAGVQTALLQREVCILLKTCKEVLMQNLHLKRKDKKVATMNTTHRHYH